MVKKGVDYLDFLIFDLLNANISKQGSGKTAETEIQARNRIYAYLTEHPGSDFSQIACDLHLNPYDTYIICNRLLRIGRIKIKYRVNGKN